MSFFKKLPPPNPVFFQYLVFCKARCGQNDVQLLIWAGNLPDMNSIESLWDMLKDEIHHEPITTKQTLILSFLQVWFHSDKIRELCKTLINLMPRRVKAFNCAKGSKTKS